MSFKKAVCTSILLFTMVAISVFADEGNNMAKETSSLGIFCMVIGAVAFLILSVLLYLIGKWGYGKIKKFMHELKRLDGELAKFVECDNSLKNTLQRIEDLFQPDCNPKITTLKNTVSELTGSKGVMSEIAENLKNIKSRQETIQQNWNKQKDFATGVEEKLADCEQKITTLKDTVSVLTDSKGVMSAIAENLKNIKSGQETIQQNWDKQKDFATGVEEKLADCEQKITTLKDTVSALTDSKEAMSEIAENLKNIKSRQETIQQNWNKQNDFATGVEEKLADCEQKISKLNDEISVIHRSSERISEIEKLIEEIRETFKKLHAEQPQVIEFVIKNAIGIIKACQEENLTQEGNIQEAGRVWKAYKELQLPLTDCKNLKLWKAYYEKHAEHEKTADELKHLQFQYEELEKTNKNTLLDNGKKDQEIKELRVKADYISREKSDLENRLKILLPSTIPVDNLFGILEGEDETVRSVVIVTLSQLYWYAQEFKNKPSNIKPVFMSFDSTIYKIFADRQELLQKLRNSVLSFINDVIFKNTPYRIMWPQLGENASANAEWYNKENDEGNEICNVKSAIVFNNNNIESVAIISTKV